jgi:hypothetical protein
MGVMLWTPELVSKGCFLNLEEGRAVVRCRTEEALARAKSLVNLHRVVRRFALSPAQQGVP